jgi:hypothetical protein
LPTIYLLVNYIKVLWHIEQPVTELRPNE